MKNNQIQQTALPTSAPLQNQSKQPLRILVVDDEPFICELNVEILSKAGYQVDAAEDGTAGWNALQQHNYDLVITDNTMPGMTGMQMIGKMHAAGFIVPVIMASGTLSTADLPQSASFQSVAELPKPYSGQELLRVVKGVLGDPLDCHRAGVKPAQSHNGPILEKGEMGLAGAGDDDIDPAAR